MKRISALLFVFLLMVIPAYSQSDCELLLQSGNADYKNGNYEKAAKMYKQLQSQCGENYGGCAAKWQDCKRKIAEDVACRKCTTLEACDAYLKSYPNGRYVDKVKKKRAVFIKFMEDKEPGLDNKWRIYLQKCMENVTESYSNGSYKGHIRDGEQNGWGMYAWDNGSYYIGEWSSGMMDGYGMYICSETGTMPNCPDCKYFCGQFSKGVISGIGSCYNRQGNLIYCGDFVDGRPVGDYPTRGNNSRYKFVYVDKSHWNEIYLGETVHGTRHGMGLEITVNGDILCAEWDYGTRDSYDLYLDHERKGYTEYKGTKIESVDSELKIMFDADEDIPRFEDEDMFNLINKYASAVKRNPMIVLVIDCYLDGVGSDEINRELFARRANNLKNLFVAGIGVDPAQILSRVWANLDPENTSIEAVQMDYANTVFISLKMLD